MDTRPRLKCYEGTMCNTLHILCTPKNYWVSCHSLMTAFHKAWAYCIDCHAWHCILSWYFICYTSSDFVIPECFYMYIVASFAHLITWSGLFPIPGSTHNFGGVPNVTNWQWTHREKEQFISFYTQNFPSSLWVFVCLTGICLWISVNLQRGFLVHGCWSWLTREAAPRGANLHLFAMLSYVPE